MKYVSIDVVYLLSNKQQKSLASKKLEKVSINGDSYFKWNSIVTFLFWHKINVPDELVLFDGN